MLVLLPAAPLSFLYPHGVSAWLPAAPSPCFPELLAAGWFVAFVALQGAFYPHIMSHCEWHFQDKLLMELAKQNRSVYTLGGCGRAAPHRVVAVDLPTSDASGVKAHI